MEWNITDPDVIQRMKIATVGHEFDSPHFQFSAYPTLTWFLKIFPNGTSGHRGKCCIYLMLVELPSNVISLKITKKYSFIQANVSHEGMAKSDVTASNMYISGWPVSTLPFTNRPAP